MASKFEVLFLDGLGAWRRWSLVGTWEKAHASRVQLRAHLGEHGRIRIKERAVSREGVR